MADPQGAEGVLSVETQPLETRRIARLQKDRVRPPSTKVLGRSLRAWAVNCRHPEARCSIHTAFRVNQSARQCASFRWSL